MGILPLPLSIFCGGGSYTSYTQKDCKKRKKKKQAAAEKGAIYIGHGVLDSLLNYLGTLATRPREVVDFSYEAVKHLPSGYLTTRKMVIFYG